VTANQIAVLLAVYRGFMPALVAESGRANFGFDGRMLMANGLITAGTIPADGWSCTPKGDAVCKFILGALTDPGSPL
jgi:hypothetical protein